MKKGKFGILSFVLLAVLAVNCGPGGNPFLNAVQDNIKSNNYDEALAYTDSILAENPGSALAYYYKGETYVKRAALNDDVSGRSADYAMAYTNYQKAVELNDTATVKVGEVDKVPERIGLFWGTEHNAAIQIATDDSLAFDGPSLEIAASHLVNATSINPDSTFSYEVLAEVYRRLENWDGGAQALRTALEKKEVAPASDYDRLSVFYSYAGDQESNVEILEEALEIYPDSVFLVQKIADAYMQTDRSKEAIDALYKLIEVDPDNATYRVVAGTQLYRSALRMAEVDSADQNEIDDLTSKAEVELKKVIELDPENYSAYNTLGVLFQNNSAALFDARNAESDNDKASELDTQAKDVLSVAAGYYEKAVEFAPNEQETKRLWEVLFRVYTTLDWKEKAEAAMEKAGF